MTTVNHFVNDCHHLNFLPSFLLHRSSLEDRGQLFHLGLIISTLEIVLANNPWDVLVLMNEADVHQCNKVDFPYLLFLCAFFVTSFHFFSIVAFSSGIIIAWDERSVIHTSWFPEACVSERQIFGVFWTIRNYRFPKFADQNNIRSSYFFLPRLSLESTLYSPDFEVYLKNFVSQIRCAARRDNMCLLSPSKKVRWKAFLRSFHKNEFVRKVVIEYRIPSFHLKIIYNLICCCLRCFGFSNSHPALYISFRMSFVQ